MSSSDAAGRPQRESEAAAELAEVAGLAHDLNNALSAISGYVDLALEQLPADDPSRPDVEEIRRAGDRAANLTARLLEIRPPNGPPPRPRSAATARPAGLAGVRGLLLDLDGVVVLKGAAIPGAAEAIGELDRRGIPYRIVTNTSLVSRASLSRFGASIGIPIPPERILSALSVSAAWTARRFPGRPLYVLAADDARREFEGQHLLTDEEAGAPGASAAAVVVGDSPEAVSHGHLNRAFRLVRGGAELVGMHKNQWWLTPDGPTIDSGAIVAGLEFATGVRARIVGKPAREFFGLAAAELAAELAARGTGDRTPRSALAMVGDDLRTDVLAAQRAGLRGVFVLTGKHGLADLAEAERTARRGPDAVAGSLAEVVAALD